MSDDPSQFSIEPPLTSTPPPVESSGEKRSPLEQLLLFGCGLVALLALSCAILFAIQHRSHTSCLAAAAIGGVFALAAIGIAKPNFVERLAARKFLRVPLALLLPCLGWALVAAAIFVNHSNSGWDECAYILSGQALRGYPTPYAAHRPPLTHFLCALFADAPALINPLLIAALVWIIARWGSQRWGAVAAGLALLLLLGQDVFLASIIDVMSELPAAILVLLAFYRLSSEGFFSSGLIFALVVLCRWNLAVIPLALVIPIALRFGRPATLKYILGGTVVAILFAGAEFSFVEHPVQRIIRGNLGPAYAWAEGDVKPDVLARLHFYLSHLWFLTPFGLLAVVYGLSSAIGRRAVSTSDWCLRFAVPLGMAVYMASMILIGGLFARFMAPIVPLAVLVLIDYCWLIFGGSDVGRNHKQRVIGMICVSAITIGVGLWPCSFLFAIRDNRSHARVFSPAFRKQVYSALPASARLMAPPLEEICSDSGFPAMVELRREILFPTAQLTGNANIVEEPDRKAAVDRLVQSAPSGSYLLVPTRFAEAKTGLEAVTGDATWQVYQKR
ncbi:MAG TPA: hypothetical protein VGP63_00740 [Planctomycetaceae bacterium]|jgi:hypothetical protein|nr:hypothetical protein [Planctomycetaceae bacterium]